jgi:hypothetical protein
MSRDWRIVALAAMLAAMLVCAPSRAGKDELKDTKKDLEESIKAMRESVKAMQDSTKAMESLAEAVKKLSDEVAESRRQRDAEARMLNERLERIERELAARRPGVLTRESLSVSPAPPPTGTIRLRNTMGVPARVTMNGFTYEVPPFASRILSNQPTGAFTYSIAAEGFAAAALVNSRLAPNETLTVTIY